MADAVDEKYTLAWTEFQSTFSNSLELLRRENAFYDVTLVSDDEVHLNAHKVVLSAASSFFKRLLKRHQHQSPLLYLNGVQATDLQFILDYVYQGEVHLYQNQVNSFLVAAAKLKISGLTNLATQQVGGQEESNIGEQQLGENPVKEETVRLEKETVNKRKRGRPSNKERKQQVCSENPEIISGLENSLAEDDPEKAETMRLIEEEILKSRTVMQEPTRNVGRPRIRSKVPVMSDKEGLGQKVMYYKEYENVEQDGEEESNENVEIYGEEPEGLLHEFISVE